MWRVNDTITFGNISVVSNFGSAFHVPSGQTLDGNFGFAKRLVKPFFHHGSDKLAASALDPLAQPTQISSKQCMRLA